MINVRSKGRRFEYIIRDLINNKFRGRNCKCQNIVRRTPMSGAIDGFKGDIRTLCTHTIWKDFGIECKNQESISIWACLEQARSQTSKIPLLIFTRNQAKNYVALPFDDLCQLILELEDLRTLNNDLRNSK